LVFVLRSISFLQHHHQWFGGGWFGCHLSHQLSTVDLYLCR
jgi:hypothetical protein